ncbi:MAG: ABC transporter permease [Lachnospiraceae bacterium]|nr:ABC transporter permease [Lachnospiraceae bacterium]
MSTGLFTRLAVDGIKKNKKLYIPYIISLAGMVAISYVLYYLVESPAISRMRGATVLYAIMGMGKLVMVVFSCLFLLYTNSFLAKRRNFEFALYNILGMNKKNVIRILLGETLIVGIIGIVFGFAAGILLSKLFELILIKMCGYPADYSFYLDTKSMVMIVIFYAVIMLILYIFSAAKVIINKPIELLRSSNAGEKEPKTNILFAIGGIVILGVAYWYAISIQDAVESFNIFFIAVIAVIVATYMLFQAGSVFICKVLKKNKKYYYNPRHFVPVSGMIYRMKRNGAGLATICILATMVMVMLGATSSLYIGMNSSIDKMYPTDVYISANSIDSYESWAALDSSELYDKIHSNFEDVKPEDVLFERYEDFIALANEDGVTFLREDQNLMPADVGNYSMVEIAELDDYNKAYNANLYLADDEIFFLPSTAKFEKEVFDIDGLKYKVVGRDESPFYGTDIIRSYRAVVKDIKKLNDYAMSIKAQVTLSAGWGFNTELPDEQIIEKANKLWSDIGMHRVISKAEEKLEFKDMYASLLLLGVFLSIVFMGACAFIIYFKQLTEGYEDASSYKTMRSVGMTVKEIKAGINSQTLITFFSPLAMAALHLAFSAPLVRKLLFLLGLNDLPIFIMSYLICFAAFALFYLLVYKKTVKSYVEIVSQ